jgi:PAS domain S-box-containing protein
MRAFPAISLSRVRLAGIFLAIFAAYFVTAKFGLSLAVVTRQVTAVWPPTGIALAAILIFGPRVWPAILLAAFLVNAVSFEPLGTALGIGVGNTLEALTGVYLLHRFTRFGDAFARPRDAFSFIALAALLATVVAALIGTTSLCLGGVVPWHKFGRVAGVWWVGDALGALVIAPLILSWRAPQFPRDAWRLAEAACMMAGLIVVGVLLFARPDHSSRAAYPVTYTVFPFVLWSSYRFGMRGATATTFAISLIALWGMLHGSGPFVRGSVNENLVMLQLFMAVVAVTGLVFGAMSAERSRAERELRYDYGRMEARVEDRTVALERTNEALRHVIADHQGTLEQLRHRDRQFAEAQATARIGSWEWDTATDTVTWSDELFRLYGLEPQSRRVNFADSVRLVHEDDRELMRSAVERARADHAPFGLDHRVVWPDGSVHWMHGQGRVLQGADGRAIVMAGTTQDIGRRKEYEDALRRGKDELEVRVQERTDALARANEALHQSNRTKDEFLATLAHELRNPLAPIRNAVEAMRDYEARLPDFARLRAIVERQVQNMVHLIDDLLDIARVERGKIDLQLQRVELTDCAQRAIETCMPMMRERGHTLQTTLPAEGTTVEADPLRLEEIVVNLLTNAAKYTPRGGAIRLTVARDGDCAVLRVQDSGVGIEPNLLDRVFDLFVQGEQGLDRSLGGLGIGLTLVRKLVEMHGGTVYAWSEGRGKGSEFVVNLPLAAAGAVGAASAAGAPHASAVASPSSWAPSQNGAAKRVLLVEDHKESRETLQELLAKEGYDVLAAADGPAGVRMALSSRPDVILIDIGLPGMSGYDVCKTIAPELADSSRLVALTGYGDADSRRRAAAAGFHMVLPKPASLADLKRIVAGDEIAPVS